MPVLALFLEIHRGLDIHAMSHVTAWWPLHVRTQEIQHSATNKTGSTSGNIAGWFQAASKLVIHNRIVKDYMRKQTMIDYGWGTSASWIIFLNVLLYKCFEFSARNLLFVHVTGQFQCFYQQKQQIFSICSIP